MFVINVCMQCQGVLQEIGVQLLCLGECVHIFEVL